MGMSVLGIKGKNKGEKFCVILLAICVFFENLWVGAVLLGLAIESLKWYLVAGVLYVQEFIFVMAREIAAPFAAVAITMAFFSRVVFPSRRFTGNAWLIASIAIMVFIPVDALGEKTFFGGVCLALLSVLGMETLQLFQRGRSVEHRVTVASIGVVSSGVLWALHGSMDFGHTLGHWYVYEWCSGSLNRVREILYVFPVISGLLMVCYYKRSTLANSVTGNSDK